MPTNASKLSDFGSGIGTQGSVLHLDNANQRTGIGTTNPQAMLQVGTGVSVYGNIGIVSATAFYGDGSQLTGIDATALKDSNGTVRVRANTSGAVITGVLTASNFSGNLTGNATGLSGSPSIVVTNVSAQDVQVGGAITITGNLTVNGTQTIVNTTNLEITDPLIGIGSGNTTDVQADGDGIQIYGATNKTLTYNNTKKAFETNIPIATNETRLITGAEKILRVDGNTVDLNYNNNSGSNIGIATNPSGNVTVNVLNIPTDTSFDDHSITFVVVVNSTGTARTCTAVTLNGVSKTINWSGGSLGEAIAGVTTTNGYSFYNFTAINTVGSASTTDNYEVFGIVSGGFY